MPLQVPPLEVPVIKWLSPNKADQGLIELWDTEVASYVPLDIGAPHPNSRLYPGFTLGKQAPVQGNEKIVIRVWVTPETSPEWFNYALKYSAEDTDYPIFIRTYRIAKVAYVPLAKGSYLGKLYKLAMTDAGSGYAVGTSPAVVFSDPTVAPALVAAAHGVVAPDGTISECVLDFDGAGYGENVTFTVEDPVNGNPASGTAYVQPQSAILVKEEANLFPEDSEFYAQYLQVVRVYETLPGPVLTSVEFERDGVKKISTKQRVQVGTEITSEQLVNPNLLVRKYYEAIDSVVSNQITESINVDSDSLLDSPELTTSIRNLIPDIFLGQIPLFTNSHIVEGEPAQPALVLGEFEHSEKALSPLFKEVRSTILSDVEIPIVITGIKETNDKKQVVSVTMTLEADGTTPTLPTATRDVDFKKLGNGLAIEVVRTVPDVFPEDSYTTSILNLIPEKFRAAIPLKESTIDSAGSPSTDPTLLTGEFSRTEGRLTEFTKRVRVTTLGTVSLPIVITGNKETDAKKQVVSIVYTLELDSTTPTVPTATRDVEFTKLGNGMAVETVRTVPEVFPEDSYTTSIENLIPGRLRANIPTKESTIDSAGSPSTNPTLLTGELSRTEGRITEFTKRVRITKFDVGSLPVIVTGIKETDKNKQVVSVTLTLEADSTTPTVPTATRDVEFDKLGNGLAVETVRTVPEVFPEDSYTKSILNLIPERLRAAIPITESTIDSAGLPSTNPTLLTGELSRTEGRITEFTKRVKITSLGAISPPVSVTDTGVTEKFGGNTTTTTSTLDTHASMTVDTGLMVIDSKVTDLGNGYDVKETEVGNGVAWPTLDSTHVDEKYGLVIPIEKKVVAAGATGGVSGGVYTEVRAIDKWRSITIASHFDTGSLPADATWFSGQRHSFPPELTDAVIEWAEASCSCSDSFSAVLQANMNQYLGMVKTRITEQFYNGTPPDDVTIDQFFPQAHNFGFAWASTCGSSDGTCRTKSGAPLFHIPLCLHDDVDLSIGAFLTWHFDATTPAALPHGDYIMLPPHVERWRFGVFRRVLTEVLVP